MLIEQLQPGDVLLFSPEKGSFLSWAITWLTDSPVSHAAMYYNLHQQTIIEETPPAVAIGEAGERFEKRTIHVRRLKEDLPMQPVIHTASSYLNEAEPYDMAGLYTVGLLLIYKKFTADSLSQKIIIKILKKLAQSIIEHINHHHHSGKQPMVCSQFVAECYDNSGSEYQLEFSHKTLALAQTKELQNLLQQALSTPEQLMTSSLDATHSIIEETAEDLCKQLFHAVEKGQIKLADRHQQSTSQQPVEPELLQATARFAHARHLSHQPDSKATVHEALTSLNNDHNVFTFPGDLLLHCDSLEDIGIIG